MRAICYRTLIISAAVGALVVASAATVNAQATPFTISANNKTPHEELSLKRATLTKVIEITTLETKSLRSRLSAIENDPDFIDLYTASLLELDSHTAYLIYARSMLDEAKTNNLTSIESLARELRTWREKTFDPSVQRLFNVILTHQISAVLGMAKRRLEKIAGGVRELAESANEQTIVILNHAAKSLHEANRTNREAISLLIETWPHGILNASTKKIEQPVSSPEQSSKLQRQTVRELIKQSVNSIKNTYRNFLTLSGLLSGR